MSPESTRPDPLAAVAERLAAGQFDEAVALAAPFLTLPAEGTDPEVAGAAVFAAAVLHGVAENVSAFLILENHNLGVSNGIRRSLVTVAALVRLLEAATVGQVAARLLPTMGGEALQSLEERGNQLATQAEGYGSGQPIRGNVWFDGLGITRLGARLADLFHRAGDTPSEARAVFMWAKLATRVLGHYDHEVIPAMNALADVTASLGRGPDAARYYAAILRDYGKLPDEYGDSRVPDAAGRFALESLAATCRAYPGLVEGQPEFDCPAILASIEAVLKRISETQV
jgi:hypothetical protein